MHVWKPTEERSPVDQLTPGQRECLRLVQQLQSSKQIARKLGISRYTVDQRIMLACRKLGVRSRAEAALMLVAHDKRNARGLADQFDSPIVGAFSAPLSTPLPAVVEVGEEQIRSSQAEVFPAVEPPLPLPAPRRGLPLPSAEHPVNRLSIMERIGWIFAISFSSIIAFGVLLGALTALTMLL